MANIIGWREWALLPSLSRVKIKAKIDTGAKTSALHAENIEILKIKNKDFVRFTFFPNQHDKKNKKIITLPLIEYRKVKSSVGVETTRPVIKTDLKLGDEIFPIELTLINRDMMGFRMLLGRDAFKRQEILISPTKSFILDRRISKKI